MIKRYPFQFYPCLSHHAPLKEGAFGFPSTEIGPFSALGWFIGKDQRSVAMIGIDLGSSSMKIASWKKSTNIQFADSAEMVLNDTSRNSSESISLVCGYA